ncbi:tetratricopeptide repeat protein [Pseudobacteriovorax antillogorgiicola]|uniref:Tetratricopeptide repeat-containing protein n=1 Tax=Pseudobacteriovorax antillogorgiicola TaxID=1513793 RepID=A0A1Y6BRD8_9BACT|nr:tetratricopeptide repeat protein [Pseudobacteriovorax antillogorgiicola]TCS53157.1 tetratricopeptide repeat protein [Pseudobacteriovorax antillogorgiicola]SMF25110.1 Tetratricopeptide repeat-containing protein [Pseudobacteriovorax antillogorgiicola]
MKSSTSAASDFFLAFVLFVIMALTGYIVLSMGLERTGAIHSSGKGKPIENQVPQESHQGKPSDSPPPGQNDSQAEAAASTPNEGLSKQDSAGKTSDNKDVTHSIQDIVSTVDQGQWQVAEAMLLEYLKLHPNDEQALVEMAMIQLIDKRDSLAAKPYLEKVALGNPNNESVINELLTIYEETNTYQEGLAFLKSIPNEKRNSGIVDYGIGSALVGHGDSEGAVEYLYRALDQGGVERATVQETLADAFLDAGRVDEAIQGYIELLDQGGSTERQRALNVKVVTAYLDRGDQDLAVETVREWLREHPQDEFMNDLFKDISSLE